MPRVTITVPEKKPQPYRFQLDRQTVRLGRGSDNDIVIDCSSVSIRHAEMERVPGGYRLRDLGSTNGTKLDGERKDLIELKNGLAVKVGDVTFDFLLNDDELAALAAESPATPSPIIREEGGDDSAEDRSPKAKTEAAEDEGDGPPKSRPARRSKRTVVAAGDHPSATGSFFTTLLLFGLAIVAFVAGLAMRHSKETGRSLFGELFGHKPAVEAPQTPPTQENPAPAGHE